MLLQLARVRCQHALAASGSLLRRLSFHSSPLTLKRQRSPGTRGWGSRKELRDLSRSCLAEDTSAKALEPQVDVQILVEADNSILSAEVIDGVVTCLQQDAPQLVAAALKVLDAGDKRQKPHELSLVIADDKYITALNYDWRGKKQPTDVLSFELPPDEWGTELPIVVLGDVVISLDTAERQAQERQALYGDSYGVLDEVRVLLVHGLLHLLGYDHEIGEEAAAAMAREEQLLLAQMGWKGQGLIEAAEGSASTGLGDGHGFNVSGDEAQKNSDTFQAPSTPVRVVCIDMDGTLLNSASRITDATADTLRQCLQLPDLTVVLATGKARPAAMAACHAAGLTGDLGLVSEKGPGLFLQGLATYGPDGALVPGPTLDTDIVRMCFEFSEAHDVACLAFLGDDTVTTKMSPYLEELHTRYYEPLAEVVPLSSILEGPPVRKVLFMTEEAVINERVLPYFQANLQGTSADWTTAVETMLEIVPQGSSKWTGLQHFLELLGVDAAEVMAIGDGLNDYEMLLNVGYAVAMGNARSELLEIADYITDDNDSDGVAKALQDLVLSPE